MKNCVASLTIFLAALLAVVDGGCTAAFQIPDSLAGTWLASGGSNSSIQLTIDANDALTNVHLEPAGVDLALVPGTIVNFSGTSVSFAALLQQNLGSVSFQGTLDSATSFTGTLNVQSNTDTSADDSTALSFVRQG